MEQWLFRSLAIIYLKREVNHAKNKYVSHASSSADIYKKSSSDSAALS